MQNAHGYRPLTRNRQRYPLTHVLVRDGICKSVVQESLDQARLAAIFLAEQDDFDVDLFHRRHEVGGGVTLRSNACSHLSERYHVSRGHAQAKVQALRSMSWSEGTRYLSPPSRWRKVRLFQSLLALNDCFSCRLSKSGYHTVRGFIGHVLAGPCLASVELPPWKWPSPDWRHVKHVKTACALVCALPSSDSSRYRWSTAFTPTGPRARVG